MKLIVARDFEELCNLGAELLAREIAARPRSSVVVATGRSPMGVYQKLGELRDRNKLDATKLRIFQLDEYIGVPDDDNRSLYGWMLRSFVAPLGIPEKSVVRLPWEEHNLQAGIEAYEHELEAAGGFDISILGLGPNGHLGFNEPPSKMDAPTRSVELTPESIESNSQYWGDASMVPGKAVTAGMNRLLTARFTLLIVPGKHKREILRKSFAEPPTESVPASLLQLAPNVVVLADKDAWPSEVPGE